MNQFKSVDQGCSVTMTGTQKQTVVAFDLYGTLLSTESIAKHLEPLCGAANAQSIAVLWRRYQLEYTWRLNSMRMKAPFILCLRDASNS